MNSTFTAIAACDAKLGIGIENRLPWKLSEDMQRFKRLTTDHTIIVGRKTFESFGGKPLPNRFNIVISASAAPPDHDKETTLYVNSVHHARTFARLIAGAGSEIFVIGGAGIYNAFMNFGYLDRILLTQIKSEFECDTHFPIIDPSIWTEASRQTNTNGELDWDYVEFKKIQK